MEPQNFLSTKISAVLFSILLFIYCSENENPVASRKAEFELSIAKWAQNHAAALTITYDTGSPYIDREKKVINKTLEYGLRMDFEIVAKNYEDRPVLREFFETYLIPMGFGYFGHGYEHVNHDALSYDSALVSFQRTWEIMKKYGLKPVSFAYPGGYGFEKETQLALQRAGFLNGRFHSRYDTENPFILPTGENMVRNWYELPSLVMEAYDFRECAECVNDNSELVPILDAAIEKHAWIILTYHNIGYPDGWGYYDWDEFVADLQEISNRDFWNNSMDNITLYIKEREQVTVEATAIYESDNSINELEIKLSDGLDNDYYDQPLTVLFEVPRQWINRQVSLMVEDSTIQTIVFSSNEGMISLKPDEKNYKLKPNN